MSQYSEIEWSDATWNPVTGCTQISHGCDHCYAMSFAQRWRGVLGHPYEQGFDLRSWPNRLDLPLRWRKPRCISSTIPCQTTSLPACLSRWAMDTFQVLTKRSPRLRRLARSLEFTPNIWVGVTVGIDKFCWRVDHLREVPAAVRFVRAEPLLGALHSLNLEAIDWDITGGESGVGSRPCEPDWVRAIRDQCVSEGVAFFHEQWGDAPQWL